MRLQIASIGEIDQDNDRDQKPRILLARVLTTPMAADLPRARAVLGAAPFVRALDESVGVHVQFLSRRALPQARRMLSRRAILRLDSAAYRRMLRDGSEPAPARYFYLVRSGVMAPVELSDAQIPAYAEEAAYHPHDDLIPGSVLIASVMTSENRQRPKNYPLLIASERPISRVSTLCMGGR